MQLSRYNIVSPEVHQGYLKSFKIKQQNYQLTLEKWDVYFGKDTLENLQELCNDIGIEDDLSSKTKCRKALAEVHVNIPQLLRAAGNSSLQVIKFESRSALMKFTNKEGKRHERKIPKADIPKGCPLRKLLEKIG